MDQSEVIVVGAGLAGLVAADLLRQKGRNVRVLEASDRAGGRMIRMTRGADMADVGAQGIYSNYPEMLKLVDRMGLTQDMIPVKSNVRFLDEKGTPRDSSGRPDLLKIIGPSGAADLVKFHLRYFTRAKHITLGEIDRDIPEYDNVSAAEALSWAGKSFRNFVLRPLVHQMGGARPEDVSLYYTVAALRLQMTGSAYYLRTGISTLAERMAASAPITFGSRVKSLLMTGDRVDGVELEDGQSVKASHVILTTTIDVAGEIVPDAFGPAKKFLQEFHHSPMPIPVFFLDRPLDSLAYSYIGHGYRDVIFNSALNHTRKSPEMVPSGKAIVSAWPALSGPDLELANKPEAEIIAHALRDLEAFIPGVANWVEEARLMRHSWGYARYAPGDYRKVLDFKRYASQIKGLSFAGNDYDGVLMESAIRNAQRAVERALAS